MPLSRSASPFLTGYFDARLSGFSFLSPSPPRLILTGYFDARLSGFRCLSPAPQRLLLTGYFTARISVFGAPSPAPPRPFLTGYFDAQVSLFRYPRAFFSLPVLVSLIVFFDALLFPTQPSLPGYLGGRLALCAALRLACGFLPLRGFYRPAVFTAPRFLPLRGFYRSAVFTAPLSPVLWGALLFHRPRACCPPVFPHFRAARSLGHLTVRLRFLPLRGFYRSAVFTAPRFLPLRGFYRSAVFTAPRFLPLRGFYRSAIFCRSAFAGSLGGSTLPFCPPVFALFRAHPVLPAPP